MNSNLWLLHWQKLLIYLIIKIFLLNRAD